MKEASVLIVDDEKNILSTMGMALESNGYAISTCENGEDALKLLGKSRYDLVLLDVMMPGIDGLEVLKRARNMHPDLIVIIMSGHGNISTAVQATKLGAYDFLEKPISREKLLLTVQRAIDFRRLENENIELKSQILHSYDMIGESPPMKELFQRIETVGATHSRVLIRGENGVGKELVARALHQDSPRSEKPFIKVNCAAIPNELIESELFGHEKGAFTGATAMRRGKFELAHRGTIFLDEIGDMHLETQAKVLRVLQENEFQRVGGFETIGVDVRVIAATNKDIENEIRRNNFREDLYFRLNVIPILVPPLRERKGDIPLLAIHFFKGFANEYGRTKKELGKEAIGALVDYPWPGNVRELQNLMERIYIMSESETVDSLTVRRFLPTTAPDGTAIEELSSSGSLKEAVQEFERKFIEKRLLDNNFKIVDAAKSLKLERSHLYKKIKSLGIDTP
ncbi:sigma-54-dependent transcriptional regulator [bacterium]